MLISEAAILVMHTHHFIRLAWIVQAEVVVDGLRRKHCGQPLGQGLQAIEGTIAADTNQALNREFGQTSCDKVEFLLFVRIHKVAGRANERSAFGWIKLGDLLVERIQMDVRHPRIK